MGVVDWWLGLVFFDYRQRKLEGLAREAHAARRALSDKYKDATPQPLLDYIYELNEARYDDPRGASYERLYDEEKKSNREIIMGASRPNPDINRFLAGWEAWLRTQPPSKIKEYRDNSRNGS